MPLVDDFGAAELVVDLSDEPVLGPAERFRWASRALAAGLPYVGADFRFDPPVFEPFELPSIAVIGTGKRVGKTAVTAHLARLLARDRDVVVVAMGRGGPAEPEVIETPPTVEELVALSRAGRHAASDHLEIAALCGVPTIGCRRAGGGLAGAVFTSRTSRRARGSRPSARPDVVVFDGSGAAIPPIDVDRRVLVDRAGHRARRVPQHVSPADLRRRARRRLRRSRARIRAELQLRATAPLEGRVAVFTAGATDVDHLEADVVHVSPHLADRDALRRELDDVKADTYLVELKAAAIDVVAEHALAHGRRVVLAANDVVADGLDEALLALAPERVA